MDKVDILKKWNGQTAVLGTKHGKESVIAPLCADGLGLTVVVPPDFDSDQFGTFTRDITRVGTPYEVAKRKALAAAKTTGHTIAIASEGSFGTHPSIPFLPQHTELVILLDSEYGIEVVGYHTDSTLTAKGQLVTSVAEAKAVATSWGFPAQGVILRRSEHSNKDIYKEICTLDELENIAAKLLGSWFRSSLFIETDMRAHRCPARMETIAAATKNLIKRCTLVCPQCGAPGFVPTQTTTGLPCRTCGRATDRPQATVTECQRCHYSEEKKIADTAADPKDCAWCNP